PSILPLAFSLRVLPFKRERRTVLVAQGPPLVVVDGGPEDPDLALGAGRRGPGEQGQRGNHGGPSQSNHHLNSSSRAPARVVHHAQDAVDAEPGVPEAGVGSHHRATVVRFRPTALVNSQSVRTSATERPPKSLRSRKASSWTAASIGATSCPVDLYSLKR